MAHAKLVTAFGSCHGMKAKWDLEDAEEQRPSLCNECGAEKSYLPDEVISRLNNRNGTSNKVYHISPNAWQQSLRT
jgi:hypothetical protein